MIGPLDLVCDAMPAQLCGVRARRNQEQDELLKDEKGVLNETSARVQLPQDNRQEPEARAKPAKLRVCRQVGGHLQRPKEMILRRDREAISAGTARHARKAKMPQNKYPCPLLSRRGAVQQKLYKKMVPLRKATGSRTGPMQESRQEIMTKSGETIWTPLRITVWNPHWANLLSILRKYKKVAYPYP